MNTLHKLVIGVLGILFALPLRLEGTEVRNVGSGPLVFSEQILPVDESGVVVFSGNAYEQTKFVLAQAEEMLATYGTKLDRAARIHGCVSSSEVEKVARGITDQIFPETPTTWVVSPLPVSGATIAVDVVAPAGSAPGADGAAILDSGVRYFVSGQAGREKDLKVATRVTMEQLQGTLQQYGRSLADAVQIKSFLLPMSDIAVAREVIESFFPKGNVPPLVFVEWQSSLPIEIELVAGGGKVAEDAEPVEYLTPEGMTSSPVFCRVVRVNDAPLVFLSGIDGRGDTPGGRVRDVFARVEPLLQKGGSDLRHLAKATYYVSTPEVSKALNELRPDYYDPDRPPAASKAMVAGGGGKSDLTIDLIAVGTAAMKEE